MVPLPYNYSISNFQQENRGSEEPLKLARVRNVSSLSVFFDPRHASLETVVVAATLDRSTGAFLFAENARLFV